MQSSGGLTSAASAAAHGAFTVLSGPAGGAQGARLIAAAAGARRRAVLRHGRHLVRRLRDRCRRGPRDRSADDRRAPARARRASTSRPSAPVAARSPGATPAAPCASVRARPGRGPDRPPTGGAGASRRSPTPTSCSGICRAAGCSPAGCGSIASWRSRRSAAWRARSGSSRCAPPRGSIAVADAEMLGALRTLTVARGIDPRGYVLMPFGGAGPLHATAIAEELGIERILCPRDVRRALGARSGGGAAATRRHGVVRGRPGRASASPGAQPSSAASRSRERVRYALRYRGQSFELAIDAPPDASAGELRARFDAAHERRYGYREDGAEVELVTVTASVWGAAPVLAPARAGQRRTALERVDLARRARGGGDADRRSPGGGRADRRSGHLRAGRRNAARHPGLVRAGPRRRHDRADARMSGRRSTLDPIELPIVLGGLHASCAEMGALLVRAAHSPNIKERRDASSALFDARGEMIMQAEHIPVHLGAMPAAVAAVRERAQHAGGLVDPQRPVRRRHPSARHHGDQRPRTSTGA